MLKCLRDVESLRMWFHKYKCRLRFHIAHLHHQRQAWQATWVRMFGENFESSPWAPESLLIWIHACRFVCLSLSTVILFTRLACPGYCMYCWVWEYQFLLFPSCWDYFVHVMTMFIISPSTRKMDHSPILVRFLFYNLVCFLAARAGLCLHW